MNAKQLLSEAKAKGLIFVRHGTYNGMPAYKLSNAAENGLNPAAIWTKNDIARELGYQV